MTYQTHRPPTRADIGKMVEVANNRDFSDAETGELEQWTVDHLGNYFWLKDNLRRHGSFEFCRVPVHSPDPIAELYVAADMLAEHGMDEAARVLMLYLSLADIDKQRLGMYQTGDSLTVWQVMLNELVARVPHNPPEPQL